METNNATLPPPSQSSLPASLVNGNWDEVKDCKILIIDDEAPNVRLLELILKREGFNKFVSTTDSGKAADIFTDFQPDLVLTDWIMPEVDGCAVIEQFRALMDADDYLPIVVLTADITPQTRQRALAAGATDFLTKPFDNIEVLLRIHNLLKARLSHLVIQTHNATLEESVRQRTSELERALSELKRAQHLVIQQERLAALGTMAGGIAHDFNNSLGIIMGFSEVLLRDAEHGLTKETATPSITTILTAAEDAAKIVYRLRGFYRPDDLDEQQGPVDLNQLITQAIAWTLPRWQTAAAVGGRTITVTAEPGEIPCVEGDAAELREVLTNLIFNAVDALPKGGAITLGTRVDGKSVVLTINDTGTGMSEEVRERCLEPFFTTKGASGTGLGLSMVFGIIQRHGGTIDIKSEPGKGTAFIFRLPATAQEIIASPENRARSNRSFRVLVVDDQPILCDLVKQHLQDDHHTVETAHSGDEALEKFLAAEFDLVITDQLMTGMTGEQLASALKLHNPKIPIIVLTGFAGGAAAEKNYIKAVNLVLDKPVSRDALRRGYSKVMGVNSSN